MISLSPAFRPPALRAQYVHGRSAPMVHTRATAGSVDEGRNRTQSGSACPTTAGGRVAVGLTMSWSPFGTLSNAFIVLQSRPGEKRALSDALAPVFACRSSPITTSEPAARRPFGWRSPVKAPAACRMSSRSAASAIASMTTRERVLNRGKSRRPHGSVPSSSWKRNWHKPAGSASI